MKLQFSANQDYQLEAIRAVVGVFEGQPTEGSDLSLEAAPPVGQMKMQNELLIGNLLLLEQETVLKNVQAIQQSFNQAHEQVDKQTKERFGGVAVSEALDGMNFSVEMETGTGKTYVYLRTIHELHRTYGFKKFVIVVPSIAIREGVLKNLQITKEHFMRLYNHPKMDFLVYDSKKRGQLKNFATTNALQILVINIDSFTKDTNIINQDSDLGVPIQYLQATQPIVIVDEPQNMETEVRKAAIANLNPLCTLRYSATHKHPYNLLYKLDPVRAYDLGLVKKIEVDSILSDDAYNEAYIHVIKIIRKGKGRLAVEVRIDGNEERGLQKKSVFLEPGDDLFLLSGKREVYSGFVLDEINVAEKKIAFTNGKAYAVGQRDEGMHEQVLKYQIQKTVENHFEKEARLKDRGIKVLSLFFIDRVANYREYMGAGPKKGKFAEWFEEAYRAMQSKPKFKDVLPYGPEEVHNGYFAQDKDGTWKDSKDRGGEGGATRDDDSAYELIMKDKERLLDLSVPLRFIFSHSALREGWDSPNVFQICTLNETSSEIKKRQEIGRGLRLPVDQQGERIFDQRVNVLTVTANESYEDFAKSLQEEIESECCVKFTVRIEDKARRKKIRLKKQYELDEQFKDLWDRIKQKTRYHVAFDLQELVTQSSQKLKEVRIKHPKLSSVRAVLTIGAGGVKTQAVASTGTSVGEDYSFSIMPNILENIQRRTNLSRATVFEILQQAEKLGDVGINPQQLMDETVLLIKEVMQSLQIDGIKYEKIAGDVFEMRLFEDEELDGYLNRLYEVRNPGKTLYNYVPYDSSVEHAFAQDLEAREDVKFYVKLPDWFKIPTPIGTYNPDWAIVFENDARVYFVAETKKEGEIRESEAMKIKCGTAHFKELDGVEFRRVEKLEEIKI